MTLISRMIGDFMPRPACSTRAWALASLAVSSAAVLAMAAPKNFRLCMVTPLGVFDRRDRKWRANRRQALHFRALSYLCCGATSQRQVPAVGVCGSGRPAVAPVGLPL